MIPNYHISITPELIFGCGSISQIDDLVDRYDGPVLLVTGNRTALNIPFLNGFKEKLKLSDRLAGIVRVKHEPTPEDIDDAVGSHRGRPLGCVVSIGGGSVIDAGKAISAMLTSPGSVKDYLEGVGIKTPKGSKIPFLAVPTTSGTGSEATRNAVITRRGVKGFKKSLRHRNFVPDIAVVDPELMVSCPAEVTAASGMDAFSQLVESYLSTRSNPFTDALAFDAIGRIYGAIERAFSHGEDLNARAEMAFGAYVSGITLANAGLGLVHGFAQPLGSIFGVPHGVVCGTLMAAVNRWTAQTLLQSGASDHPALKKYARIGKLFAGSSEKHDTYYVDFCIHELERITAALQLPPLSRYGVKPNDLDGIVSQTTLKYHPVQLNESELKEILTQRT